MTNGRFASLIFAGTLVLWRILVVGLNNLGAIRAERWIDSSIWLTEDPLAPLELWVASLLTPKSMSDRFLMYVVEIAGLLLWMIIAAVIFAMCRRLAAAKRIDTIHTRPFVAVALIVLVGVCGYVAGFFRMSLVQMLNLRNLHVIQAVAILTFVVIADLPLILYIVSHRKSSRNGAARIRQLS